jgi:hypothetical protein
MNKKSEKRIVKIAGDEVKRFIREWNKNPYLWDSEADIHGELYIRIKKAIKDSGFNNINGQYKRYMRKNATFNRVYCEPLTYIDGGGRYYPDIVIYSGFTFNDRAKKRNEPMLWVCEIKYKTQWCGDQSEENRKYDRVKLKKLLRQRHGTKYAYFLELERTKEAIRAEFKKQV